MKMESNKRNERGITLVALIITIIILVILVAISISTVYNSKIVDYAINGTIGYAGEAIKENEIMGGTENLIDSTMKKIEDILRGNTPTPEEPVEKPLVTTLIDIQSNKVEAIDRLGNWVTVPKGFKYKEGEIAEKGIVIEDIDGNQFVWIPVSNINHDGTNKIKRENGTEVEITLGRYQFYNYDTDRNLVKSNEKAYAVNYAAEDGLMINGEFKKEFKELKTYSESNRKEAQEGTITTAKDIKGFIESAKSNHGYYIARYEASYGSGYNDTLTNTLENAKPLSKVSTSTSYIEKEGEYSTEYSMNYTTGTIWGCITQPDAAMVCKNMYSGNVKSDLVNSYAWDTAIVFIEEMGNKDYSIKLEAHDRTIRNTGETGEKVCNIFDMAGNIAEWTTELSTYDVGVPGVYRGTDIDLTFKWASFRWGYFPTEELRTIGFRCILYV